MVDQLIGAVLRLRNLESGQHFSPEGYKFMPERECYQIPAAEFEAVVLPYFEIALDFKLSFSARSACVSPLCLR